MRSPGARREPVRVERIPADRPGRGAQRRGRARDVRERRPHHPAPRGHAVSRQAARSVLGTGCRVPRDRRVAVCRTRACGAVCSADPVVARVARAAHGRNAPHAHGRRIARGGTAVLRAVDVRDLRHAARCLRGRHVDPDRTRSGGAGETTRRGRAARSVLRARDGCAHEGSGHARVGVRRRGVRSTPDAFVVAAALGRVVAGLARILRACRWLVRARDDAPPRVPRTTGSSTRRSAA